MPARYETIAGWANEFGWTRGAELGLFDGKTLLYLLEACPQLHMIGVDVWDMPGFAEGPTKSGERCFCQYCAATRASRKGKTIAQHERSVHAGAAHFGSRSVIWKGRTADAAALVEDGSLAFVFVDGDHSQEGVSADILHWRSKIKAGGRLIGHDWNMQSVRDGVLSYFQMDAVEVKDDHVWWVRC